jgi:NAD(P)-dependent dehydrogenase (short-subunit alcohol dehydrogenase family)
MVKLLKKNIIITGGANGVGLKLAFECIKNGANVIIVDNDSDAIKRLEKNPIFKTNNSKTYFCDLGDAQNVLNTIDKIKKNYKQLHGLVYYAGITSISSLLETDIDLFDNIMNINLKSAFLFTQLVINDFIDNNYGGSIIYFGSPHYEGGHLDRAPYSISKGGLFTLSNHVSKNYAKYKIRSNYLIMGWTLTEGEIRLRESNKQNVKVIKDQIKNIVPMKVPCDQDDIVQTSIHLLSDDSKMMTGSIIKITGGLNI